MKDIIKLHGAYRKILGMLALIIRLKRKKSGNSNHGSAFTQGKIDTIREAQAIFDELGTNIKLDENLLMLLDFPNPEKALRDFYQADTKDVLDYFQRLYAEFEKIVNLILKLPTKTRTVKIHEFA